MAYDRPQLIAHNSTRWGPAGTVPYTVEIAAPRGVPPVLVTATVPEGQRRTAGTPKTDLSGK